MNRRISWLAPLVAGALSVTLPAPAQADATSDLRYPIAEAARPITLPKLVFAPEVTVDVLRIQANDVYTDATVQAGMGITDDVSVRALVAPLQLAAPAGQAGFQYGQSEATRGPSRRPDSACASRPHRAGPELRRARLHRPQLVGRSPHPGDPDPGALRHAGEARRRAHDERVDRTGDPDHRDERVLGDQRAGVPLYNVTTSTVSDNLVHFDVPITLLFNVADPVFVSVNSGVTINDLAKAGATTGVPLGFSAGFTVPGRQGPLLDVMPYVNFPYALWTGAAGPTVFGEYAAGVKLVGFLYF